ncbi:hypothetical protein SASPL_106252 [Salvia splendens]|uniref:LIM zinc-binding domain-containing protein n=1 Tax=Salvia splendens TaxID=180675 RepID=A0A8X8YMI6_SALSN|nr:hypothetical protein SASPL_106252 [Salvia splendens]
MGWFNKIFKGSEHKVSEGQYDWRYGAVPVENNPSTSWDSWSEMEDIDRAIALSLSEEDPRGATIIDSEPQLEEDELLARAIQESLNVDSPAQPGIPNDSGVGHGYGHGSGYEHGNARGNGNGNGNGHGMGNAHGNGHGHVHGNDSLYQPISFPYSISLRLCLITDVGQNTNILNSRICAGCNTEIGHGRFLSCMSAVWHPECFRCNGCRQPISDYEFSMSGNYPYHKTCYKESYHPKCDLCNHFSWDAKFAALNDGRILCLECLDSAIMDTDECQPLFLDILEFYEGLNMRVTQQVPLLLVERQALNEAMDGERHGHHHMPETRGLCLSEEQTVSTLQTLILGMDLQVMRRPRTGGNRMLTEPYKLTRHCEVTAILILYGLPRLLTGSILAHELMHAWLRLNGYRTLRQDVEEGICQVLASMWLESQILSMPDTNNASTSSSSSSSLGAGSPFEKKLSIFFKHQIATDSSVIYGNGFRAGNEAVLKYGLQRTLDHMRETGNFPY